MKRFAFRLESILNLRRASEEAALRSFGAARVAAERHTAIVAALAQEETQAHRAMARTRTTGDLRIVDILAHERHIAAIVRRLAAGRAGQIELDLAVTRSRDAYLAAARDRKALERLRERRHDEWTAEFRRDEQKEIEAAALRAAGGF